MQTAIDTFHARTCNFFVAHIGFNKLNFIQDSCEIASFACEEIINNPYETTVGDELFTDVRTNKTGSAGY
jgi:hypothetical protein